MTVERPAPPADHPLDIALRETVLVWFEGGGVATSKLWARYKADFACRNVSDVEHRLRVRYSEAVGVAFSRRYVQVAATRADVPQSSWMLALQAAAGAIDLRQAEKRLLAHGPMCALLALPEIEFLVALRMAVDEAGYLERPVLARSETPTAFMNRLFTELGVPYRHSAGEQGGQFVRAESPLLVQTLGPARLALSDGRLASAAQNFDDACRKLATVEDQDLDDVVRDAARAVSEALMVIAIAHYESVPKRGEAGHLFSKLRQDEVLPGSAEHLVLAAANLRNPEEHQRGKVRSVARGTAEASLAAAAGAITFLHQYLPPLSQSSS